MYHNYMHLEIWHCEIIDLSSSCKRITKYHVIMAIGYRLRSMYTFYTWYYIASVTVNTPLKIPQTNRKNPIHITWMTELLTSKETQLITTFKWQGGLYLNSRISCCKLIQFFFDPFHLYFVGRRQIVRAAWRSK